MQFYMCRDEKKNLKLAYNLPQYFRVAGPNHTNSNRCQLSWCLICTSQSFDTPLHLYVRKIC